MVKCHAGCTIHAILDSMAMTAPELFYDYTEELKRMEIETTYDYQNEKGENVFQVVRAKDKMFYQRKRTTQGWEWNLDGVERYLYRLPEVLAAIEKGWPIFVVEGEKDVETLRAMGLVATTNPGGAGKWLASHTAVLSLAAKVVVIPDNDATGTDHAANVCFELENARVLALPVPPKEDVTYWLSHGGTKEELVSLSRALFAGGGGEKDRSPTTGEPQSSSVALAAEVYPSPSATVTLSAAQYNRTLQFDKLLKEVSACSPEEKLALLKLIVK